MTGPPDCQLQSADESDASSVPFESGRPFLEPASFVEEGESASTSSALPLVDPARMTRIEEAQKQAKFAISALQYEDVPTAKASLLKALSLLDSL